MLRERLSPRCWRRRERVTVGEVEGWRRARLQVEGTNRLGLAGDDLV